MEGLLMLSPEVLQLIKAKSDETYQVVFGTLYVFFQTNKRFPEASDIPLLVNSVAHVCVFLNTHIQDHHTIVKKCLNDKHRTIKRYKEEIRALFGFRLGTLVDKCAFINHCKQTVFPSAPKWDQAVAVAHDYLSVQKIEPYSEKQLNRLLTTAHQQFESEFFVNIEQSLKPETKKALDALLTETCIDITSPELLFSMHTHQLTLTELKQDQVQLKIDSILVEVKKYQALSTIVIPNTIEHLGSRKLLEKYYKRVLALSPSHLKNNAAPIRYAYLAIFCLIKKQMMTDTLTDLLLKLLKRILTKAERSVDKALALDNKRVKGKMGTLLVLAKKSIDYPDGIIKNTIYPDITQERLTEIINDLGEDGQWYRNQVKTKALSLYSHNNRRIVWALMGVLDFDANPELHGYLNALNFIKKLNIGSDEKANTFKERLYSPILIKKVIPANWLPFVRIKVDHPPKAPIIPTEQPPEAQETLPISEENSQKIMSDNVSNSDTTDPVDVDEKVRINWNACELALFEQLKVELPVKNIWVKNAFRYRNPIDDMPADFDENEDYYFNLLGLPKEADVFISDLKERLDNSLFNLDESIPTNAKVIIKNRGKKGNIKITPFEPQAEPQNLELLKQEIAKLWPNLQLIDILKEADFRIGFTKCFESVATREALNEDVLRKRLLLCAFGFGSNIGLKRMSGIGAFQENYDDLRYVKRRFMTCQNVQFAIQEVVNAIHKIRDPNVWGYGTIACAADSKKMSVWDQNLLVEWHARYGGRGVMIYWHVDKKGLCIHSKLKTCSSSEVSAMIHGVLHHDTDMDIKEISADTHGQSSIGFAFSELFGFDLLPRIKNINKQKLYCSSRALKKSYTNLTNALASDIIDWELIRQHYRDIVRHAAALKVRSVESDVLLKRLSADNKANPIYQSLLEIGKASRTIFLCRYLSSEKLRIDINEALNVVERVNGIMEFIFYGRLGEISTNMSHDQELSLLCLHLLQVCMVYINTIFIQTALSDPKWASLLTSEDWRALSPLFHGHINPYGSLSLDMNTRIIIETHRYKENFA